MMFKITAYGVRSNEVSYFNDLNKNQYELNLIGDLLTHENVETAKGSDAVLLRANCVADATNLAKFNEWGIKYVFTRTVGFNHIDLKAAASYNMKVARVPAYSPYAVAELAMTLGMMSLRHTTLATSRAEDGDFTVAPALFSREVHSSTVGIIGTGKIGATEASLYKGMGTRVLGYDPYPSDFARQFVTFVDLDKLLAESDIVSIHVPYFPGQNENMVDEDFLKKMKNDAVLVNTARGELVDHGAVLQALQTNTLGSFATDVLPDEKLIFGHQFSGELPNKIVESLRELYPRVLMTPHMGSYTKPALTDMIAVSYQNFEQVLANGHTDNDVKLD
ncbi:D-lactate dehydrogenase [Furfurilactobacillus rossiae]|uniref:D-isomer specific 2-hydroxyacid dehydrogenase, catalytic domain protein n=2 Tax=Furfurilactobacillus rossiae TaxID=231049 RepID=A0A0R1RLC3_9LACO|nr:NAD(P)-dependent oxidoreductase [Furfurilactobacillus rossiae]KRL57033.1 D-isomer specific 2-hydroxyacid dehydrogenase, catalytic domain protein [Furfurilactobacillus rossiae DSM 15814]QLE61498.1 D-lactate dehydrogenase [Furfurilactobacillus rossiae]